MREVALNINGRRYALNIADHELLIDVLRDKLHLYGSKKGCGSGECGSCSVLIDGAVVNACLVLACRAEGRSVITIEGLAPEGVPHPLQQSFIDNGALQCGFCGSGMVLAAKALVDRNPFPTEQQVRQGLAGNLCRCTGYTKIIKAVQDYAVAQHGGPHE